MLRRDPHMPMAALGSVTAAQATALPYDAFGEPDHFDLPRVVRDDNPAASRAIQGDGCTGRVTIGIDVEVVESLRLHRYRATAASDAQARARLRRE